MNFDPGLAVGRSHLLLFSGMIGLAGGTFVGSPALGWGGLVVVVIAFALNSIGKVIHYRSLPIPGDRRAKLIVSWILLAVAVVALFVVFLRSRFGESGEYFWTLALAAVGFALLHRGLQRQYLGGIDAAGDPE